MANKILASSLDNFLFINSSSPANLPYVTFGLGTVPASGVVITITDANDENGYRKEIVGKNGNETTVTSFNTAGEAVYTLMECLRMNSIFYNISLISSTTIKAYLDTSLKYNITSTAGITVGGNFASYSPTLPNKSVLIIQENDNDSSNIIMEKYHNKQTASFNITSPYQRTVFRRPIECTLKAYTIVNGVAHSANVSPYTSIAVMPTTLSKFQGVNYDDYLYTGTGRVKFLTTQSNRYYNYGEWVGLSFLSSVNIAHPYIKKNFYTNSGVFLETEWTTQYVEVCGDGVKRYDVYDNFELAEIEAAHDKQVGYVLVYFVNGNGSNTHLTDPIRFDILPHCDSNNEIFFLNEIGGVDSFNFTNTKQINRSIGNQSTYNVNQIKNFESVYEHQYVNSKVNKITTTLSTHQVDVGIADWLNQLVKSKYTYKFLGITSPRYKMIVVDKFDIQTNTNDAEFELSLEYHDADNDISK